MRAILILAAVSLVFLAPISAQNAAPLWHTNESARQRPSALPQGLLWEDLFLARSGPVRERNFSWQGFYSSGQLLLEIVGAVSPTPSNSMGVEIRSHATPLASILGLSPARHQALFPADTCLFVVCGLTNVGNSGVAVCMTAAGDSASSGIISLPVEFPAGAVICRASIVGKHLYAFDVAKGRVFRFYDSNGDLLPDALDSEFNFQSKLSPSHHSGIPIFDYFAPAKDAEIAFVDDPVSSVWPALVRNSGGFLEIKEALSGNITIESSDSRVSVLGPIVDGQDFIRLNCLLPASMVVEVSDSLEGEYSSIGMATFSGTGVSEKLIPLKQRLTSGQHVRVKSSRGKTWSIPSLVKSPDFFAIRSISVQPIAGGVSISIEGVNLPTVGTIQFHGTHLPAGEVNRISLTETPTVQQRSDRLLMFTLSTPGSLTLGSFSFVGPGGVAARRLTDFYAP